MNLLNIFHFSYYTDNYLSPEWQWFWPLVIIWGLGLIITIVFNWRFIKLSKKWSGDHKFWWTHILNMGYTLSVVSLVHLFFRYENIPYLNWRLWPALMVLGLLGWGGYLVYYRYRLLPKKVADRENRKSLAYYFRRRRK